MRPILHPSASEITVEGVLHALADPVRAQIFAGIAASDSALICSAFAVVSSKAVPKSTLSLHFKILREAGLIRSERKGVRLQNIARLEDLRDRFGNLIDAVLHAYERNDGIRSQSGPQNFSHHRTT
jgi:DNA-binding transcriptional ArsR family regulator